MDFSVKQAELAKELGLLRGAVESKTTIPILSNVRFDVETDSLTITATDLDVSIQTRIVAKVKATGSCCVPATALLEYVKLLEGEEVRFKGLENNRVGIKCGHAVARLVTMPESNFPSVPAVEGTPVRFPLDVLAGLIHRTEFAVSHEDSRYTLQGALLTVANGKAQMVATDGHRLALASKSEAGDGIEMKVLLPRKAMGLLRKLLDASECEFVEYSNNESTLFFRLGPRVLRSLRITGAFPNYAEVIPKPSSKAVIVAAETFERSLRRAAQFSDDQSEAITLELANGDCLVRSASQRGEAQDKVVNEGQAEPLVIGFCGRYLLDFLKICPEKVRVELTTKDKPALMMPAQSDGWEFKYVVMPMRVNG